MGSLCNKSIHLVLEPYYVLAIVYTLTLYEYKYVENKMNSLLVDL